MAFTDIECAPEWSGCSGTEPELNPDNYVRKDGSTMTGELVLTSNPTQPGAALRQDEIEQLISESDTVITDLGNGTYSVVHDYQGTGFLIDTTARSNPFQPTGSALVSTNVQDALIELDTNAAKDLNGLSDVDLTQKAVVDGDILLYSGTEWLNESVDGLLGSLTFTANQPGHGFTSANRGAPVVIINDVWDFAIATNAEFAHRAIFLEVIDADNIRLQTSGLLTGIDNSVTLGPMTIGEVYRLSAEFSGTVTSDELSSGDVQDDVYYATGEYEATIVPTTPYNLLDPTDPTNPLPAYGDEGASLVKASNTSYDVKWEVLSTPIPAGGLTGTVLAKATDLDYSTEWLDVSDLSNVPDGGTTGQVLSKIDNTDLNVEWSTLPTYTTKVPAGGSPSQILSKIDGTDYNSEWITPEATKVPSGGSASQVLTKVDGADYNSTWETPDATKVPAGGTTNQLLVKASDTDYDSHWVDISVPQTLTGKKLVGYEEEVVTDNTAAFDYTAGNFFVCTPTGHITIAPVLGGLTVVSSVIHINNSGGFQVNLPANSTWVGSEPTLSGNFMMSLFTYNGGSNWYAIYLGEIG